MNQCIFCQIVAGSASSYKILEDDHCYAFLDINPINRYHTLVIPKTHYIDMFDLPVEVASQIMNMIGRVVKLYAEKLDLQNLQIMNSSGKEAQQDVFHIHYHIIPRHFGDGQNIHWKTHPEWRQEFQDMIDRLQ